MDIPTAKRAYPTRPRPVGFRATQRKGTKMARRTICKYIRNEDGTGTFKFQDADATERHVDASVFPDNVQVASLQYGAEKRLKDGFSQTDGPEQAVKQFDAIYAAMLDGQLRVAREGGGPVTGKRKRALFNLAAGAPKWAQSFMDLAKDEITQENVSAWYDIQDADLQKTINGSKEMRVELARMATEDANAAESSIMG